MNTNTDAIDKIFNNLDRLIDDYNDFPETTESENKFWEYADRNILKNTQLNIREFENVLCDVTYNHQRQGFIYGFQYAADLFINNSKLPE